MAKTKTYTKGFQLPLMRPVPLPIPEPAKWWNLWAKTKNVFVRAQPRKWTIEENYIMYFPWLDCKVCVPKGFVFDGASVPRVLWPFMSPTGIMFIAGLFHDLGYRYNCWFDENHNQIYCGHGQAFFDDQIERMGTYINDARTTPNICWAGLRLFGWAAWNKRRKEGHDASVDFPPKDGIE